MDCSISYHTMMDPGPEVVDAVREGLQSHNRATLLPYVKSRFAVFIRNDDNDIVGGLIGDLVWDWLHITILWVAEQIRGEGVGSELVRKAEEMALSEGITQAHVETTSFQALPFYQSVGYEVFAELEGKPSGHTFYYLKKTLQED